MGITEMDYESSIPNRLIDFILSSKRKKPNYCWAFIRMKEAWKKAVASTEAANFSGD